MATVGEVDSTLLVEIDVQAPFAATVNGTCFEYTAYAPTVPANAILDSIVVVGDNPVAVISRVVQFNNSGFAISTFKNPTYTGGTPQPVFNINTGATNAPTTTILSGALVTNSGPMCLATKYLLGDDVVGQARTVTGATDSTPAAHILGRNTTYLIRVVNLADSVQKYTSTTVFLEGEFYVSYP